MAHTSMLRASGHVTEIEVDLHAVKGEADAGVPGSAELIGFVDAALTDPLALPAARDAVIDALGARATVRAAAVIGNFEKMNRIADACGIPALDPDRSGVGGLGLDALA